MIFTYKKWDSFCYKLRVCGKQGIPAKEVVAHRDGYVVLKHDVETNVKRAYKMASIEKKHGHRGSYYVQAYLLQNSENIALLGKIQAMGHEVSYHYDVMDSNKGDFDAAMEEFEKNRDLFEKSGFPVVTVCQHGNPVVERIGYTSNRDFFRSDRVKTTYPNVSDIMVNFKEAASTDYVYFSDAGRRFKLIYDPINNDIVNSDDKNVPFEDLDKILDFVKDSERNVIISTHPHRWTNSALVYLLKSAVFKTVRITAKILMKVPVLKKIMSRYYYLAKKF